MALIMHLLKHNTGRAAIVLPDGFLFGEGTKTNLKRELLEEFNLHTIVRLPKGVFAPYTSIPTNLLFFDRSGPTREVWYYEQPLPAELAKQIKAMSAPALPYVRGDWFLAAASVPPLYRGSARLVQRGEGEDGPAGQCRNRRGLRREAMVAAWAGAFALVAREDHRLPIREAAIDELPGIRRVG